MGYEVLYNFISPVTGRILCDPGMVLVGDSRGIAIPSLVPPGSLFLPFNNLFIGNESDEAVPTPNIQLNNMAPLGLGNIWQGSIDGRPVETSITSIIPPFGDNSDQPNNLANSALDSVLSSLVKLGLEKLVGSGAGFLSSLLGGVIGTAGVGGVFEIGAGILRGINGSINNSNLENDIDDKIKMNSRNNSMILPLGAEATSGKGIVYFSVDMGLGGGRITDIASSPQADYDAVNAKWVWDLLNDNVEILWQQDLT